MFKQKEKERSPTKHKTIQQRDRLFLGHWFEVSNLIIIVVVVGLVGHGSSFVLSCLCDLHESFLVINLYTKKNLLLLLFISSNIDR